MLGNKGRGPRRIGGFLLAVATSALLFAWWTGVASAARGAGTPGATLEVCKIGDGTVFSWNFTLTRGQNVLGTATVPAGGGCQTIATNLNPANVNGPIDYKLTESPGPDVQGVWAMTAASASGAGGPTATLNAAKQVVTVNVGTIPGEDDSVSITNTLASSTLKICKTTSTAAFFNTQFSFTANGQGATATTGTNGTNGSCTQLGFQQGTKVTVIETNFDPNTMQVTAITPLDPTHPTVNSTNLATARAVVTIGAGTNVLTFNDESFVAPQMGSLQICKKAADNFINQIPSFHFTIQKINDPNTSFSTDVAPGQCSGEINGINGGIPIGNYLVTELIPDGANWQLQSVTLHANSAGGVGNVILANGSAIVVVPDISAGDTVVDYTNVSNVSTVKVCKILAAGSGALTGSTFNFTVTDSQIVDSNGDPIGFPVSVVASAPGTANACKFVQTCNRYTHACVDLQVPVGSTVEATESNSDPFIDAGAGAGNDFTTQPHIVTGGVNELDITNRALGQLEFCKYMVPGDDGLGQTFTFKYSGPASGTATTTADNCTFPVVVPAGTYTVSEDLSKLVVKMNNGQKVPAFLFAGSDARGPFGDSRCVPPVSYPPPAPPWNHPSYPPLPPPGTGCGASFQVTVPYFNSQDPSTGETVVSFWNSQVRGNVKVCKLVSSNSTGTIGSTTWTYDIATTDGFATTTNPIGNGGCTGRLGNFPVALEAPQLGCSPPVGSTLCPNVVTVTEDLATGPQTTWYVSNITLTGGYDPCFGVACSGTVKSGVINYHTGAGTNVVTYTNTACSLATGCPIRA